MTLNWWTLGIQTVNIVILVWLLGRFFWRPLAAMIDQRRDAALKTLADAEAKRTEAAAALADIAKTRAGFAKERDDILGAAQAAAKQMQDTSLADTAKQVATLQEAAKASLATEHAAADTAWTARASHLAVDIAKRLAARLNGAAVQAGFLDWLVQAIHTLPDPARQSALAPGVMLDAVSATDIPAADQERYRSRIAEAFAGAPQISFKTDPALIAGLDLRGPELAIANSWAADLTTILADLAHDDRH